MEITLVKAISYKLHLVLICVIVHNVGSYILCKTVSSLDFLTLFLIPLPHLWISIHILLPECFLVFVVSFCAIIISSAHHLLSLLKWAYPHLHVEIKLVVDDDDSQICTLSLDFSSALVLCHQVLPGYLSIGTPSHHGQTKCIIFPNSSSQSGILVANPSYGKL